MNERAPNDSNAARVLLDLSSKIQSLLATSAQRGPFRYGDLCVLTGLALLGQMHETLWQAHEWMDEATKAHLLKTIADARDSMRQSLEQATGLRMETEDAAMRLITSVGAAVIRDSFSDFSPLNIKGLLPFVGRKAGGDA